MNKKELEQYYQQIIKQAEEGFDKNNNGNWCCDACDGYNCKGISPKVKSFLRSHIKKAYEAGKRDGLNGVVEIIKKLEDELNNDSYDWELGYKKSLSDLRNKIKELIK